MNLIYEVGKKWFQWAEIKKIQMDYSVIKYSQLLAITALFLILVEQSVAETGFITIKEPALGGIIPLNYPSPSIIFDDPDKSHTRWQITLSSKSGTKCRFNLESTSGTMTKECFDKLVLIPGEYFINIESIPESKNGEVLNLKPGSTGSHFFKISHEKLNGSFVYRLIYFFKGDEITFSKEKLEMKYTPAGETRLYPLLTTSDQNKNYCIGCHSFSRDGKSFAFNYRTRTEPNQSGVAFYNLSDQNFSLMELKNFETSWYWVISQLSLQPVTLSGTSSINYLFYFLLSDKGRGNFPTKEETPLLIAGYDPKTFQVTPLKDSNNFPVSMNNFDVTPDGKMVIGCNSIPLRRNKYNLYYYNFETRTAGLFERANHPSLSSRHPYITRDGKWIIFTRGDYPEMKDRPFDHFIHRSNDLYIVGLNSGTAKKLECNSESMDSQPFVTKDGKWLVFSSKRLNNYLTKMYVSRFDSETGTCSPPILYPLDEIDQLNCSVNFPMVSEDIKPPYKLFEIKAILKNQP